MSTSVVNAAINLADRGFRVLPVLTNEKRPAIKGWQTAATTDAETIAGWWVAWPDAGVGVCLGPASGVIDIECDTDEAERQLIAAFGGVVPFCPTFLSGSGRGRHRIFRYREGLPEKANVHFASGIDFKLGAGGRGSMAIFPPSGHPSGGLYRWLDGLGLDDVDPPELPDTVVAFLHNETLPSPSTPGRSGEDWKKLFHGTDGGQGLRHNSTLSVVGKILRSWGDLSTAENRAIAFAAAEAVNAKNRPPLPDDEFQRMFDGLLSAERRRRLTVTSVSLGDNDTVKPGVTINDGDDFRVVIIETEPPTYELYGAAFGAKKVVLSARDFVSGQSVKIAALEQCNVLFGGGFVKKWSAGGIAERAFANSERRPAAPDEKRPAVIASLIWAELARSRKSELPDPAGRPTVNDGGITVFTLSRLFNELTFFAEKITKSEISEILAAAGIGEQRIDFGGVRRRFRVAGDAELGALLRIADGLEGVQSTTV